MRDFGMCIIFASVVGFPHLLTLFACVLSYTHVYLRAYKSSVAGCSLFLDIYFNTVQVSDTLFERIHVFASANLCYPTIRPCSYFSIIFAAHLRVYTRTMGCKRSFSNHPNVTLTVKRDLFYLIYFPLIPL